MRDIAHDVSKLAADGVILMGEAWMARADASKPYMRAADAPDKIEMCMGSWSERRVSLLSYSQSFIVMTIK
jgi:hypothetical protein